MCVTYNLLDTRPRYTNTVRALPGASVLHNTIAEPLAEGAEPLATQAIVICLKLKKLTQTFAKL